MAKLRLCAKNAFEFATLTASPAAETSLPVTNLQLPKRVRLWQSTSDAAQTIYATWGGTGYYLNHLALWRHNLESGSTRRVEIFSTADWTGTAAYDSGTAAAYDYASLGDLDFGVDPFGSSIFDAFHGQLFSLLYFPRTLAVSVKITLTNTGNTAGFLQASYLHGGDYTELQVNARSGGMGWKEKTSQEESDGGSPLVAPGIPYREMPLDLATITAVDRPKVADMLRYAGMRKPVFAALYPGMGGELERDHTVIGRFMDLPDLTTDATRLNLWASQVRIREI